MTGYTLSSPWSRGGDILADFARMGAIVLASLAFSAGLYLQAELPFLSALIVGIAMFLVLASSFAALARTRRYATLADDFESSARRVEDLIEQLRDMEQFADQVALLDHLKTRIDNLEQDAMQAAAAEPAAVEDFGAAARLARMHRLEAEVDRLTTRMEALRQQFELQANERQEKVAAELQVLETLIKQMAERMAIGGAGEQRRMAEPVAGEVPAGETPRLVVAGAESAPAAAHEQAAAPATAARVEQTPSESEAARWEPLEVLAVNDSDAAVLEAVRRSVEANKIDLYLQPIVTLPQRRVRYYEALTRLRDGAGRLLLPKDYLRVAESAGMMPLIDNVMLYRSVQVLRRLSERNSARGVFCNISLHSLLDPEFFPEFLAFMEQNRSLADSLFFEFGQAMFKSWGPIEQESLRSLASLGFRFALDQVDDLDVDFQALHNWGFRFVKISADLLLHRVVEAGARIHPADMRAWLERQGLQLVVEKIEDERSLAAVLGYDVTLGQGYLFSEPRPVRPEVFETAATEAAAA